MENMFPFLLENTTEKEKKTAFLLYFQMYLYLFKNTSFHMFEDYKQMNLPLIHLIFGLYGLLWSMKLIQESKLSNIIY